MWAISFLFLYFCCAYLLPLSCKKILFFFELNNTMYNHKFSPKVHLPHDYNLFVLFADAIVCVFFFILSTKQQRIAKFKEQREKKETKLKIFIAIVHANFVFVFSFSFLCPKNLQKETERNLLPSKKKSFNYIFSCFIT